MIKTILLSSVCCLLLVAAGAQPTAVDSFLAKLRTHCGKAFEGTVTAGGREGDGFTGRRLLMQVRTCESGTIQVPFYVGDDRSRVWVLKVMEGRLQLKHDHTHQDGKPDAVTQYGGWATNTGNGSLQVFPADQATCDLLPAACGNVWWMTLTDTECTYNLRRIGTDRLFTVRFDLTRPVASEAKPWGWE